jgi:hypothetical protein
MKNNIDYYQHFCNADQHPKFKMLRVKYGWEGEGRFWALNNRIGLSDNCRIDLNKKYNQASLADDLGLNLDQLNEFIDYLHDECNLIIKENGFVTTEIVNQNLEKVMNKRKRNQTDYEKKIKEDLRNIKNTEIKIQTSEKTQSKVKESKVKETKKNKAFQKPQIEMLEMYFNERGVTGSIGKREAEKFYDFYECKGWYVGKNKMKDWKCAVNNWIRGMEKPKYKKKSSDPVGPNLPPQQTREEKIEGLKKIIAHLESVKPLGAGDQRQYEMMKNKLKELREPNDGL